MAIMGLYYCSIQCYMVFATTHDTMLEANLGLCEDKWQIVNSSQIHSLPIWWITYILHTKVIKQNLK